MGSVTPFPSLTEGELLRFSELTGVDRVSFSFPVRRIESRYQAWNGGESRRLTGQGEARLLRSTVDIEGGRVFVGASHIPATGATYGKLEFNPSRFLVAGLASVDQAVTVAQTALSSDQVQELVEPACAFEDVALRRVDVARDFEVERPEFFIRGHERIPRPYARKQYRHNNSAKGNAETLFVGGRRNGARMYDKHAENSSYPEGTLRLEHECRSSGWLDHYGGMRTMKDLTVSNVGRLALDRWKWGSFGAEIGAHDRVLDRIARAGLSPALRRSFIGYLFEQAHGLPSPMSNDAAARFRRLQRQLGVAFDPEPGHGVSFVSRLDYESGGEVLRVA